MTAGAHPEFPLQLPSQFNIAEEFVSRPAREHPERVAILGEPRAITYGELAREMNRVAGALRRSGVSPGDRVLIVIPDSLEFIAAFFGAARIGAIAVPVNPLSRSVDFGHYLENSDAKIAIVHEASLPVFLAAAESGALAQLVIISAGADAGLDGLKNPNHLKVGFVSWVDWLLGRFGGAPPEGRATEEEVPLHPTA